MYFRGSTLLPTKLIPSTLREPSVDWLSYTFEPMRLCVLLFAKGHKSDCISLAFEMAMRAWLGLEPKEFIHRPQKQLRKKSWNLNTLNFKRNGLLHTTGYVVQYDGERHVIYCRVYRDTGFPSQSEKKRGKLNEFVTGTKHFQNSVLTTHEGSKDHACLKIRWTSYENKMGVYNTSFGRKMGVKKIL